MVPEANPKPQRVQGAQAELQGGGGDSGQALGAIAEAVGEDGVATPEQPPGAWMALGDISTDSTGVAELLEADPEPQRVQGAQAELQGGGGDSRQALGAIADVAAKVAKLLESDTMLRRERGGEAELQGGYDLDLIGLILSASSDSAEQEGDDERRSVGSAE